MSIEAPHNIDPTRIAELVRDSQNDLAQLVLGSIEAGRVYSEPIEATEYSGAGPAEGVSPPQVDIANNGEQ